MNLWFPLLTLVFQQCSCAFLQEREQQPQSDSAIENNLQFKIFTPPTITAEVWLPDMDSALTQACEPQSISPD